MSALTRRNLITTGSAALTGSLLGAALYRGTGPDLTFAAEEWLRDARALGMLVMLQPDGQVWRTVAVGDGREREEARAEHWRRLNARPRLLRAVHRVAEAGFIPEARA